MASQAARFVLLAAALLFYGLAVEANASSESPRRVKVIIVDARLRSAFLQRAIGMDRSQPLTTATEKRRELQRHFDAVIGLLLVNAERSLETSLDRLEERRGEHWSDDQRIEWRQRLMAERIVNIRRLKRYRDRGLFPINEHAPDRAVPVFVDNNDTACAVGHLMRESGWSEEVAAIQAKNNLVYVTDVSEGPVVDWVATSGLTQEEAAIIQPAYGISPAAEAGILFGAGGEIEVRGVLYDSFEVSGSSPGIEVETPSLVVEKLFEIMLYGPSGPRNLVDVSPDGDSLGAGIRFGEAWAGDTPFVPLYDRWVMVSPNLGETLPGTASIVSYEFEVAALSPRERIDSITLVSDYVIGHWAFPISHGGHGFAGFEVWSESNELLGSGAIEDSAFSYLLEGRQVVSFSPQERVKVRVGVFAWDGFSVTGLGHEVNLISVPEASSWAMSAIIMTCIFSPQCRVLFNRRRKQQAIIQSV